MSFRRLLPIPEGLRVESVQIADRTVTLEAASARPSGSCPCCNSESRRVHSRYLRRLSDLPWQGVQVQICWRSRKFFCDNADCQRKIFTERLPEVAEHRARRTHRLELTLRMIALACGGEPGARLASRLGMPINGDSLLRIVRRVDLPPSTAARVIGVDDWAYRRGQRYGTLICDLETHRPIDLLPDRSAESFHQWLVQRPGIQVISRDRGEHYTRGATSGAPEAVQVADRWHLLRNLSDTILRLVERNPRQLETAWQAACQQIADQHRSAIIETPPAPLQVAKVRFYRDARRRAHFEQTHQLFAQGRSQRSIAKELGIHRETVQRYLSTPIFPERLRPPRRSQLDAFRAQLWEYWRQGCRTAMKLHRQLAAAGFSGSYSAVQRCVRTWRKDPALAAPAPKRKPLPPRPTSRRTAWLLLQEEASFSAEERALMKCLVSGCSELAQGRALGMRFGAMVRNRRAEDLAPWLQAARIPTAPREFQAFARSLQSDLAAVQAALQLPWSNGQTEGHIHRLKALKRQMYGRARFDLLRIRMLNAA